MAARKAIRAVVPAASAACTSLLASCDAPAPANTAPILNQCSDFEIVSMSQCGDSAVVLRLRDGGSGERALRLDCSGTQGNLQQSMRVAQDASRVLSGMERANDSCSFIDLGLPSSSFVNAGRQLERSGAHSSQLGHSAVSYALDITSAPEVMGGIQSAMARMPWPAGAGPAAELPAGAPAVRPAMLYDSIVANLQDKYKEAMDRNRTLEAKYQEELRRNQSLQSSAGSNSEQGDVDAAAGPRHRQDRDLEAGDRAGEEQQTHSDKEQEWHRNAKGGSTAWGDQWWSTMMSWKNVIVGLAVVLFIGASVVFSS